jgi:hypothetical protein
MGQVKDRSRPDVLDKKMKVRDECAVGCACPPTLALGALLLSALGALGTLLRASGAPVRAEREEGGHA